MNCGVDLSEDSLHLEAEVLHLLEAIAAAWSSYQRDEAERKDASAKEIQVLHEERLAKAKTKRDRQALVVKGLPVPRGYYEPFAIANELLPVLSSADQTLHAFETDPIILYCACPRSAARISLELSHAIEAVLAEYSADIVISDGAAQCMVFLAEAALRTLEHSSRNAYTRRNLCHRVDEYVENIEAHVLYGTSFAQFLAGRVPDHPGKLGHP